MYFKKFFFPAAIILLVILISIAGCNNSGTSIKNERPNFLFILVDDLGKEWISAYGADSVNTPFIDQLAAEGVVFENVYSMPQCTPSRVTLLTGKYPYKHGWINHYDVPRWGHGARFDSEMNPTFISFMKKEGYKTCAAGKWQINDFRLEPDAMIDAGFDDYCMWTGGEGNNLELSSRRYWDPYIHTQEGSKVYKGLYGPDIFTDFLIDFLSKNRNAPMFIYYPMVLTHGPLVTTPLEPNVETKAGKHKAMVRYTDYLVEKLINALDELGIRDKTYIIFTTDNGSASSILGYRNGYGIWGGKTYLTENGINAPFIVNKPGIHGEGEISSALIDFTDFFPTFLDLAGIDIPSDVDIDGHSFSYVFNENQKDANPRKWILAMGSHPGKIGYDGMIKNWYQFRDRAIRDGKYKVYIDTLRSINRLFDLEVDPFENQNLIRSNEESHIEALQSFRNLLLKLPKTDNNPAYTPLDTSIYNIPPENLERSHNRDRGRSNMSRPAQKL